MVAAHHPHTSVPRNAQLRETNQEPTDRVESTTRELRNGLGGCAAGGPVAVEVEFAQDTDLFKEGAVVEVAV